MYQLQPVGDRLTLVMVVRDDVSRASLPGHLLDARLPFGEFLHRVQVIVPGCDVGKRVGIADGFVVIFLKPLCEIAPVQPDIANRSGNQGRRRHRMRILGLVDIAKTNAVVDKDPKRLIGRPARVAHFRDQRVLRERLLEPNQVTTVFGVEFKRPGKLHQHAAETSGFGYRIESFSVNPDVVGIKPPFMREHSQELGCETEAGIKINFSHPQVCHFGTDGPVERCVDFENIKVVRQIAGLMKASRTRGRIYYSPPILLRPAGAANADFGVRRHEFAFSSPPVYVYERTESSQSGRVTKKCSPLQKNFCTPVTSWGPIRIYSQIPVTTAGALTPK